MKTRILGQIILFALLAVSPALAESPADARPISTIGKGSKLILNENLEIPAGARSATQKFSGMHLECRFDIMYPSNEDRVLPSGQEIAVARPTYLGSHDPNFVIPTLGDTAVDYISCVPLQGQSEATVDDVTEAFGDALTVSISE